MEQTYCHLEKLQFKVIREKNDHFYPIVMPSVIRRDFSFREDKIIQQSVLLDMGKVTLLSKVHFLPSDPKILKVELGIKKKNGIKYITIEKELEVVGGKIRILTTGSLPCQYLRITFLKGCPVMNYKTIQLFGINVNEANKKFNEDVVNMLYTNTYEFLW